MSCKLDLEINGFIDELVPVEGIELVSDPNFYICQAGDWTFEGTGFACAGKLVVSQVNGTRYVRLTDASGIKAGKTYLVKVDSDMDGVDFFLRDWNMSFLIGGRAAAYPLSSIGEPFLHRLTTQDAWREGVLITALEDGTPGNTYIKFLGITGPGEIQSFSIVELIDQDPITYLDKTMEIQRL